MAASEMESALLRQRLAELESEVRDLRQRAVVGDDQDSAKPVTSVEDAHKLRAGAPPFKIRNWDIERLGSQDKPGHGISSALVPFQSGVENENLPLTMGTDESKQALTPVAKRSSAIGHWIVQPELRSSDSNPVHELFAEIDGPLLSDTHEALGAKITDIFIRHLQDFQQPHLTFSAAFVSLYNIIRDNWVKNFSEAANDEHQTKLRHELVDDKSFSFCANLLRQLKSRSRFEEKPPRRRPEDIGRAEYVRELCVQAGLSLDLARLGFVHKKELKRRKKTSASAIPLDAGHHSDDSSPSKTRLPGMTVACVEVEEMQSNLARAGRYLGALQMDMDRHHDDMKQQIDVAMAAVSMNAESLARQAEHERLFPPSAEVEDGSSAKESSQQALEDEKADEASMQVPAANTSIVVAIPSTTNDSMSASSFWSAVLTPTFGEFIDQQLLPLYVADVPFDTLRHLAETYCGLTLDSDDERKAWKALGVLIPERSAAKSSKTKRRRPKSSDAASVGSSTPKSAAERSTLAELREVMEKPQPVARAQMPNSTVGRREKGFRTQRDMNVSLFRRSGSNENFVPTASPIIKTARALLQGSTPLSGVPDSTADWPASSPISMRKTSRWRQELQNSAVSTRSEYRSRTPQGGREDGAQRQIDWHLMEITPAKDRR
jgi:hypothetical protein